MVLTEAFWTKTYQTSIARLTGICYRYTRNYQLSEDLAHEGFLKAIEKSESFRGDGNVDAWLRRIVVNHVLQYLRDQKKHPYVQQLSPDEAAAIAAPDNTVEQPVYFTVDELLQVINTLPEHHRLVFNLYVMEKWSHAEIGNALGIAEGTSKSHMARARKKLQQLLIEKVNTEQKKDERKRAAVLLLALRDDAGTDKLFTEGFERFELASRKNFPLQTTHQTATKMMSSSTAMVKMGLIALIGVVVSVAVFLVAHKTNTDIAKANMSTGLTTEKENVAQPATILRDSVNTGRNKKRKTMKPLDSLALVLALSSATMDTSAKDSIRGEIENISEIENTGIGIAPAFVDSISPANIAKPGAPAEKGTFRASELVWNRDTHEVFFKGSVRVDFGSQHFQGRGSFNILGPVYLLTVDGEKIVLGKTVKLSKGDYHLSVLTKEEAIATYGPSGENGAVVINIE